VSGPELVVVGLDGACWDYLDPLIEAGRLPALAQLRQGLSGDLATVRPPISCPAWFSYATGQTPGSLGLWGWRNFDPEEPALTFNAYDDLTEPELWDFLGRGGLRSAVINIPTTFPPKRIDGAMVAGMQAEERQAYTEPPELKAELRDQLDYRVAPDHKMRWDPEQAYAEIRELVPKRFAAAEHLAPEVDVLHVTIFHLDEIQHTAWDTPELAEAWELVDEELGRFLDRVEPENLVVMSDHGFGPRERVFNLNTWLQDQDLLALRSDPLGDALRALGLTRQRLERGLRSAGLLTLAKRVVPRSLQKRIQERDGASSSHRRLPHVDWPNTRAFASTNFTIHVLEGDPEDLAERLAAARDPDGESVFAEIELVADRFEDVKGPAPDLLVVPSEGIGLDDELGRPLWRDAPPDSGDHRPEGILALRGEAFDGEASLEGARLIDLAPTLLHLLGCPIPERVDGRVLDVLATDEEPRRTSWEAQASGYSPQQLEDVEERLRGLGYLGQTGNE
jgi:predicted AlkP superfamily phosphohydrolase/phosphomutase